MSLIHPPSYSLLLRLHLHRPAHSGGHHGCDAGHDRHPLAHNTATRQRTATHIYRQPIQQCHLRVFENPPSNGTNAGIKQFPKRLEDLLQDNRQPNTVRYLRKIFADPITGKFQWGLLKGADGGIIGVYSLSEAAPLKTANFGKGNEKFANTKHYSEWQFTYGASTGSTMLAANGTPVNQTPVNTTLPEYQVPPVQPMPFEPTADQSKHHMCEVMRSNDASICANLAIKFNNTAGATCMASANQRYAICTGGANAMLPPLAVQYK